MLIDAHSHIHFKDHFPDVDQVIARAEDAGVDGQVLIGCNVKDSRDVVKFVKLRRESYGQNNFWCAIGVHPHDASQLNVEVLKEFETMIVNDSSADKTIVAIGEIGLDYFRNFQSEDIQKNVFMEQLKLAKKLDLPVVIHMRDAWDDTLEILDEVGNKKVVLHSFTGGLKEAQECIDRGYYISFSGMLTYPKNDYLRNVARMVPRDKFMVETDCPYLPPQIFRGKRNEPAYVVETAKEFARVNDISFEETAGLSYENTCRFFGIGE